MSRSWSGAWGVGFDDESLACAIAHAGVEDGGTFGHRHPETITKIGTASRHRKTL